jgi:glycosyltransferase involved in cell wall biosynthesis
MSGTHSSRTILFVNHWAEALGGAEYSLLDILEGFSRDNRIHLVTSEEGELTRRARTMGVTCHVVPTRYSIIGVKRERLLRSALASWRGMVSFVWFAIRVRRLLGKLQPDIVQANVPKSHLTVFLSVLMGYRGTCCFHVREIFVPWSTGKLLYRLLFPRKHAHVLAISHAVKTNLPRRLSNTAEVIHNGVEVESSPAPLPGGEEVRFLYLGRMVPWKGCHLLIDMFAELRGLTGTNRVSLSLIGDTLYWPQEYRTELQELIQRRGLTDRCVLQPHTEDPRETIKQHHVLCCASRNEPFGRVVAEAQGCGRPVVAFAGGGVGEILRHRSTGLLVDYGDQAGFISAMASLANQRELIEEMGRAAHRRAA